MAPPEVVTSPGAFSEPGEGSLSYPPRRGEQVIRVLLMAAAVLSVLTTVGIVLSLLLPAITFFRDEAGIFEFLFGGTWDPRISQKYGVWPLINGTLLVTGIALLVAIPLGLGTALYLSEYARPRVRRAVKPVIELLAGVPTIVFGFFVLTFFTPEVIKGLLNVDVGTRTALGAGVIMGFMVIPTVASVSEDGLSAVPQSLREGAYGLGASKVQVSLRVVFPAALSGVVAAIVLGASRAIGETMIVLLGAGLMPNTGIDPRPGYETMTTYIGATAQGDIPTGSLVYKTVFAVGITLFVMTLLMNIVSIRFVRRFRQVYE
ncbi:MAG: phosphate ABC transporter permease subunit PstC [Solirubrobacteraceae bacterium]